MPTTAPTSRTPVVLATAVLLVAGLAGGAPAQPDAGEPAGDPGVVEVRALSNRADLVSGGDVLAEVVLPAGVEVGQVAVDVDGRDVTGAFTVRADGRLVGLVDGLVEGRNALTATVVDGPAAGNGATLTVTNHPIGGPVFSGPQIQPWTCDEGALDEQCNREPTIEYQYMPAGGGGLQPYDPDAPADDVATTTTDDGDEVPFIVRVERGVIARDNYVIAVLHDPAQPWAPGGEPQAGYTGRVVAYHGASCDTEFQQAAAPDPLDAEVLGRGFATYSHALNNSGHNCHPVTQAEAMVMTKERIVEQYGEIRYQIGSGCSGGALAQYWMANAYPGLYQGITVACSFMDAWSSANQYVDYDLLRAYFESPEGVSGGWTPAQWAAVYGHPNAANAITFTEVIPNGGDPKGPCPGVPAEATFHPDTNPDGVKCSLQDWMVNVFGQDDAGYARRPYDNVGVQYGLQALLDGTILPEQFVALNTGVGSFDLDYDLVAERTRSDDLAAEYVYRSGGNNTAANLDEVAIIDYRGPDPGAFHDTYRTYAIRDRLIRQHGDADNMVLWRGSVPLFGDATFANASIFAMDRWLAAVEADDRDIPLADKIAEDRPEDVTDRCADGATGTDAPAAYCDAVVEVYETPRIVAGAPTTDDVMRCELVPIDAFDYSANPLFTEDHREALRAAFPDGVCDYARPDPHFAETVPWLDYSGGPGGLPMGPAPVSVPFGPAAAPQRLAGPERTSTAAAISASGADGADVVVIASATAFADALVASPLAARLDAPLLLTDPGALSGPTAAEIARLGAGRAILVGGEQAVGAAVADALVAAGLLVERVAGGPGEVVVAGAEDFADALSGAALAASAGRPLLLTAAGSLPEPTGAAVAGADVIVVGGESAVSVAVEQAMLDGGASVRRLDGDDRYATSAAVAAEALERGASTDVVWLATGRAFPDGLVAGAAAARDGGILLLVDGQDPAGGAASRALLLEAGVPVGALRLAGGVAAISQAVEEALVAALR
jgi:hypothetical protein